VGKPHSIINGGSAQESSGKKCGEGESVEDRINGLARVLGIPSKELASAIAGAVGRQQDTPPAGETLLKDENEKGPGVVGQVLSGFAALNDELE